MGTPSSSILSKFYLQFNRTDDVLIVYDSVHRHQVYIIQPTYRSFTTTLSQLKICNFSGETFKGFELL